MHHRKEDDKMNEIKEYTEKVFEDIKHIDELGNEYWLARELQNVLGYHQWRSINDLIERAKVSCKESKHNIDDHFALYRKMVNIGSKTSSSKDFVNERNPKYSIISVGKNNRYGHPNKEVLDNLDESKIYRTDQDGSIMLKVKNNKLKIETCSP